MAIFGGGWKAGGKNSEGAGITVEGEGFLSKNPLELALLTAEAPAALHRGYAEVHRGKLESCCAKMRTQRVFCCLEFLPLRYSA
jgi:hypothetical protein